MPDHWHRWRDEDGAWIEARHWNVRWDLAVQTTLPRLRDTRLARAVRQELWRELRDLRGFRPAVKVALGKTGVTVTAGGQVDAAFPKACTEARVAALLEDPSRRARWTTWSGPA